MVLEYGNCHFEYFYLDKNTVACPDKDIAMIYFDNKKMNSFKDMTKRFAQESSILQLKSVAIFLRTDEAVKHSIADLSINGNYRCGKTMKSLEDCFKYSALTESGDCGTPLMVASGPMVGKILGIHVAGSANKFDEPKGMATIVSREKT